MDNLYMIVDRYGNSIPFKMTDVQRDVFDNLHTRNLILKARQLGMCLDPNTLVLTDKFTWVRIADLLVGDRLVGVDEFAEKRGKRRKLNPSTVQAIRKKTAKRYRITLDDGKSLVCTGEHRWLTRNASTDYHWRSINGKSKERIKIGHKIRRCFTDTWENGDFNDGWMGGMLDGEGSLATAKRLGGSIGLSQIDGPVFKRMENYFKDRGYNYRIEIDKAERKSKFGKTPVNKVVLSRIDEIIRLVGITKPTRFLNSTWWHGKEMPQVKDGPFSTVVDIEDIGEGEVVDLQTSTKTFIADGYVSHNSTFSVLYLLDEALFNFNISAGVVSYSLQHAQHIFKRIIGHAIDNMPEELKGMIGIVQRSAHEISFSNGSFLRVDTTLRGGTCQLVLISEFGKTCARSPIKADEVISGTLNTLSQKGVAIIESTGEGTEGFFAEMCLEANERGNENLSPLDYKLFFYPWYKEKSYRMNEPVQYTPELADYFDSLEKDGIKLDNEQKYWYAVQTSVQGDKVKQEYPSTVVESFLSNSDAYYYAEHVHQAYVDGRVLNVDPFDPLHPVYAAMDIGVNDATVITIFQVVHGEIRVVDCIADNGKGVDFYANKLLYETKYHYSCIFLPHDAARRDGIIVENSYEKELKKLFSHTDTKFIVLKRNDRNAGIAHVKTKLSRCVFNIATCKKLLDHLAKYRKKWSESTGRYLDEPLHDEHSDWADSARYMCHAVSHLESVGNMGNALERHKRATEMRNRRVY